MKTTTQQQQQKIDRIKARFGVEIDRLLELDPNGVVTITAEIRLNGGGIRSSEIFGGVRCSV